MDLSRIKKLNEEMRRLLSEYVPQELSDILRKFGRKILTEISREFHIDFNHLEALVPVSKPTYQEVKESTRGELYLLVGDSDIIVAGSEKILNFVSDKYYLFDSGLKGSNGRYINKESGYNSILKRIKYAYLISPEAQNAIQRDGQYRDEVVSGYRDLLPNERYTKEQQDALDYASFDKSGYQRRDIRKLKDVHAELYMELKERRFADLKKTAEDLIEQFIAFKTNDTLEEKRLIAKGINLCDRISEFNFTGLQNVGDYTTGMILKKTPDGAAKELEKLQQMINELASTIDQIVAMA